MGTVYLKVILNVLSIFIVAKTALTSDIIKTDKDVGNCTTYLPQHALPGFNMKPKIYEIQFTALPHIFSGKCKILVDILYQTNTVQLNAYKIKIDLSQIQLIRKETMDDVKSKIHIPVEYRYCTSYQILHLQFEDTIQPGLYYLQIFFDFETVLPTKPYTTKDFIIYDPDASPKRKRWFFTNLLEPIVPRRLFPCWDHRNIKAIFNISIVHPAKYKVFSNMLIQNLDKTNKYETYFISSGPITASELAIIVIDNAIKSDININFFSNTTDYIWYYPEAKEHLNFARYAMNEIRTYLYRYPKQSKMKVTQHFVIPIPMKTIESPGLIIYSERDVIYRKNKDFVGAKIRVAQSIGKQMIRVWFSEIVNQTRWYDMWIRESIATYFSYSFPVELSQELEELFVVQILQPTLYYDIALNMRPISLMIPKNKLTHAEQIDIDLYSRFYRNKGAILLRMLQQIITPRKFEQRLGEYLAKAANNSIGNNLWLTMEDIDIQSVLGSLFGENAISNIMSSWTKRSRYPELYVTTYERDYRTISEIVTASCEDDSYFKIPMSIFKQASYDCSLNTWPEKVVWTRCYVSENILKVKKYSFIIPNMLQVGYYRVNYESKLWQRIVAFLQYGQLSCIPVQNRAQLIDDAYHFVMLGMLNASTWFNLIGYLGRETHFVAWYPMFNILFYMSDYLKVPASHYARPIVLGILKDLLEQIGYVEYPEDTGMTKSLRLLAAKWSCKLGHKGCRETASNKLYAKYNVPDIKILPWWEEWVYSMGMMQLDLITWHRILRKSIETSNISALKYLAYTEDTTLVLYYINFITTNDDIIKLMGNAQLTEHYRFTLKRHLKKKRVRRYVLGKFTKIADRFYYENDTLLVLWGDIIFNIHSRREMYKIVEFSNEVDTSYSPGKKEIRKMIKARRKELRKIYTKYSIL